jgi:uracil-DNA glycosylase
LEERITKKFLALILLVPYLQLFAQNTQEGDIKQTVSETVPNAYFPFGQPLKLVKQQDRTPKKVFVLGVYSSAVHAAWYSADGEPICPALAVASEPYIFWNGENAADILSQITIPSGAGQLKPPEDTFNGSSGRALDALYLAPLGFSRSDAWLCDLVPHFFMNDNQKKAIRTRYNRVREKYGLPVASIPEKPGNLIDANRLNEITAELEASQAETIILLGDEPIKWFLSRVSDCKKTKLADFGSDTKTYGFPHAVHINGKQYTVIPLAHVRQGGSLGRNTPKWERLHKHWVEEKNKRK